jgi:hypothetical protein
LSEYHSTRKLVSEEVTSHRFVFRRELIRLHGPNVA